MNVNTFKFIEDCISYYIKKCRHFVFNRHQKLSPTISEYLVMGYKLPLYFIGSQYKRNINFKETVC
jgi:hypothetical protein